MGRYRIGRADTNDIVLAEPTVSREHAELVSLDDGRFHIKDLGSTYGIAIRDGTEWRKVAEAELAADAPLRIGDYETIVGDLVRDTDRTVVRPRASAPTPSEDPPPIPAAAPPEPARTEPPRPAPPKPPRPAAPRPAAPQPGAPSNRATTPRQPAAPSDSATTPPQPTAPAFQALRNLPPEKRTLVWIGVGFAAFLLIALITLILALVL